MYIVWYLLDAHKMTMNIIITIIEQINWPEIISKTAFRDHTMNWRQNKKFMWQTTNFNS